MGGCRVSCMGGLPAICRAHIHCGDSVQNRRANWGNGWSLPGGMTELDVPRSILMDVDRIRDYINIIRVVTEDIGEDRADIGFHTAAAVRARLISAPEWAENYTFPVPRNDDHWYILRLAISEEVLEARIKLDICRIIP